MFSFSLTKAPCIIIMLQIYPALGMVKGWTWLPYMVKSWKWLHGRDGQEIYNLDFQEVKKLSSIS